MTEETQQRINGPVHYVKCPLTRRDNDRTIVLHLFSDMHSPSTNCRQDSVFLHELINTTLSHYQERDDEKIDIFTELGFGEALHEQERRELDTGNYLRLFNSYYLSRDCLYRPHHPECHTSYPNARFHNGDYRTTLFSEIDHIRQEFGEIMLTISEQEHTKRLLQPILDQHSSKIPINRTFIDRFKPVLEDMELSQRINASLRSRLNRSDRIGERIIKLQQMINSASFTAEEKAQISFQKEFYTWGRLLVNQLDAFINEKYGTLTLEHIQDGVPTTQEEMYYRYKCYELYRFGFIGFPIDQLIVPVIKTMSFFGRTITIPAGYERKAEKWIVESIMTTDYIRLRFHNMMEKLDQELKHVIQPYFHRKWEELKQTRESKHASDFFMDYYCMLRILGNFRDGTTMTRVMMYAGLAHVKQLLTIFMELNAIIDMPPEIIPYVRDITGVIDSTEGGGGIPPQCIEIPVLEERGVRYLPFTATFSQSTSSATNRYVPLPTLYTNPHEKLPISSMQKRIRLFEQGEAKIKQEEERLRTDDKGNILHTGDQVMIYGIQAKPELNGQVGTLGAFFKDDLRWEVTLPEGSKKLKTTSVRKFIPDASAGRKRRKRSRRAKGRKKQ